MHKKASSVMRVRMRIMLMLFMGFGFAVIIGRLFLIQIVHGEKYQQRAVEQQTRATNITASRGTIYDRNMNTLAKSATVWNVCISPAEIKEEQLRVLAPGLAEILEIDVNKIYEEAADKSSYYQRIKMRVDLSVYEQVLEYIIDNEFAGVFFEQDTKRYYTYGTLASTVLGFTNYDNQGAYGLEAYYNKTLSGTSGMVVSVKNAKGSDMPFKYQQLYPAQNGNSIVLTIDEGIQHFLERNLETAVVEHSIHERAAGIVMNVKTGEILAMATKPDFNPNDPYTLMDPEAIAELAAYTKDTEAYNEKLKQLQWDQWRNKAISDPYEPGSVFKIITAATALDNNAISLNDHFFCDGSYTVSGVTIGCWKHAGHGSQNFVEAIQNSCNPAFIVVGQRIGAPLFHSYMNNFGLGEATGIDLPGEAEGILPSYDILNKPGMVELSSTSFGQSFKVTPLQLITATSAAVNGGQLMQPYIVKQVLDSDDNVIETYQPVIRRQVISEETSETVRYLVEQVVQEGSGSKAAIPGYRIGGKTGTSQKLDVDPDLNILSFVGFAPMDDPQIAVLIMLDEPELDNIYGSVIAAPVVGAVLQETLPYLGLDPQYSEAELLQREVQTPNLVGLRPHDAQAELTERGLKTRVLGSGGEVIKQIPLPGQNITKGGTVILYTEEDLLDSDIVIPSVVGLSTQEANRIIVGAGLNVEIRGITTDGIATVVVEQKPAAGESAETGDVITITLAEKEPEDPAAVVAALGLDEEGP